MRSVQDRKRRNCGGRRCSERDGRQGTGDGSDLWFHALSLVARHPSPVSSMIDSYHSLLTPEIAESSHAHLEGVLRKRGLVFGGRPLCTVLRPRLMTVDEYSSLQARLMLLLRAFRRIHDRAMTDAAFRAQFGLADWEETLLTADPGYSRP